MNIYIKQIQFLCLFLFSSSSLLIAQTYQFEKIEFPDQTFLTDIGGARVSGDINGDGKEDLVTISSTDTGLALILRYLNNSGGDFTMSEFPIDFMTSGASITLCDLDNDSDLDIIMTGSFKTVEASLYTIQCMFYFNDGFGNFLFGEAFPVQATNITNVKFEDIDVDGDVDLLIAAQIFDTPYLYFYLNTGSGSFSEFETIIGGSYNAEINFADIDNDSDPDLLVNGQLYINDGYGNYEVSEVTIFSFYPFGFSSFFDFDGDNDIDILISEIDDSQNVSTKVYINDGQGNFTSEVEVPFPDFVGASLDIADFNNDGLRDVLIIGNTSTANYGNYNTMLFLNSGNGDYIEYDAGFFHQMSLYGQIVVFDADADGDQDVILIGSSQLMIPGWNLYFNDGNANFSQPEEFPIQTLDKSTVAFADVDLDGDLDFAFNGRNRFLEPKTTLYYNDGLGNYLPAEELLFTGLYDGDISLVDLDSDSDLDLFVCGTDSDENSQCITYINNGDGQFLEMDSNGILALKNSVFAFADIDNDEDEDLMIQGVGEFFEIVSLLYINNGEGVFSLSDNNSLTGVQDGGITFADIDGDNDLDLLRSGYDGNISIAELYVNNDGIYSLSDNILIGRRQGAVQFIDLDGDSDQDIMVWGRDANNDYDLDTYINDGQGNFNTIDEGILFPDLAAKLAFADIDGDNDQDIFMVERVPFYNNTIPEIKLFQNDGLAYFNEIESDFFDVIKNTDVVAFADIDGDNDQDVFLSGSDQEKRYTQFYRNATSATPFFTSFDVNISNAGAVIDQENQTIEILVSPGADLNSLISSYQLSYDATVEIDGVVQTSGESTNDFDVPVVYELTDINGEQHIWTVTLSYTPILNLKVYLEGAYNEDTSLMNTTLRAQDYIPIFNPYNGDADLPSNFFDGTNHSNVVDWIAIEIRQADSPTLANDASIIERHYGFLLEDGTVIDRDGNPFIYLNNISGSIYVVVKHRNHLAIMSSEALTAIDNIYTIDFSLSTDVAWQNGQKAIGGIAAMYAGDANNDGVIKYVGSSNDPTSIYNLINGNANLNSFFQGYSVRDINLDGTVKIIGVDNDDQLIFNQVSGNENLNNTILEQLPTDPPTN